MVSSTAESDVSAGRDEAHDLDLYRRMVDAALDGAIERDPAHTARVAL